MNLKGAFYNAATVGWMGLVVGAWIAIDLGFTEPWLSFSDIPGGSGGGMATGIVLMLVGWVVIGRFNARHESAMWEEVGKQAGLRPAEDGQDADGPELTGTVDGRPVTAWYDKRKRGGGGESGGRYVTFTLVEAELSVPADEGIVVGRTGERDPVHVDDGVGTLDFDDVAETASDVEGLVAVESENLVLVGRSAGAVEAVADVFSGDTLRAIKDLKIASVGDASGVVASCAEARNEELEGSIAEYPVENLVERVPGDATTVTFETKVAVRDGDELRQFAERVVATADAFETATDRTLASG